MGRSVVRKQNPEDLVTNRVISPFLTCFSFLLVMFSNGIAAKECDRKT